MLTAIYCRVSTDEQVAHGRGLEAQEADCRARAAAEQWTPVRLYTDPGVSGTLLRRPGLDRLLEDARAGQLERVLCADPDRLARDLGHLLSIMDELGRCAVEVRFLSLEVPVTPDGRLLLSLRGAIAEFETHRIRQRMLSGKRARAKEGRPTGGGQAIYGYRYVPRIGKFELDPAEAAVVREAFRLALDCGTAEVAHRLDRIGVPPRRGGKWSQASVHGMLRNPAYLGWLSQMGGLGKVRLVPLVSPGEWQAVQAALDQRRNRPIGPARHPYLLTGRLVCGVCGRRASGGFGTSGTSTDRTITRYACSGKRSEPRCTGHYYRSQEVDERVWQTIVSALREWARECVHEPDVSGRPTADRRLAKATQARVRALERAKARLVRAFGRGWVADDEFARSLAELRVELDLVRAQAARQEAVAAAQQAMGESSWPKLIDSALQVALRGGESLDDQRGLLRALGVRVTLGPGHQIRVAFASGAALNGP